MHADLVKLLDLQSKDAMVAEAEGVACELPLHDQAEYVMLNLVQPAG